VSDKDKAEMMAKAFVNIHSSDNISEEGKRERSPTMRGYLGVLGRKEDTKDVLG